MNEIELRKHRCCFTGHRPEKLKTPENRLALLLEEEIKKAIASGFTTYITGMAKGTDIVAGEIILRLREQDDRLKLICALPHPGFGLRWGGGGGRVFAFHVDRKTGGLTEINHVSAFGSLPAYIRDDGTGEGVVVCCHSDDRSVTRVRKDIFGKYALERIYGDTPIVHYPILKDGSLGEPDDILVMKPAPDMYACIHSINRGPDGRTLIACDRNLDLLHRLSCTGGKLSLDATLQLPRGRTTKTGACPRYSAFHPTLPIVYVNSEYGPDLYVVRYDGSGLELAATADAAPEHAQAGTFAPSDLAVSADGSYLYMLYRKINVVCVFSLAEKTGEPVRIQTLQLKGQDPRGLRFSPDGKFLLVAERNSNDIASLAVAADGTLTLSSVCEGQPSPGNIIFM